MIASLRGTLKEKRPPFLLVEVQGVGYELESPLSTFERLPAVEHEVRLYTHLAVREDTHLLFAFLSEAERGLFRSLIKVNGIGARTALAILSGCAPEELVRCVQADDVARLCRLPGIGKKTAQRLIVEMRDRLPDWQGRPGAAMHLAEHAVSDAIQGLIALGYKPQEASRHVQGMDTQRLTSEAIIRAVLRNQVQR